jgi:hypothetical protein
MDDITWIAEIDPGIAKAALEILDEICAEMDLLHDPVVIWPYVPNMGIGQEENVRNWKMTTLGMLRRRGVIRSAEFHYGRTQHGGDEGIWIDADETTVREVRRLLRERLYPRKYPKAPPSPAPGKFGTYVPGSLRGTGGVHRPEPAASPETVPTAPAKREPTPAQTPPPERSPVLDALERTLNAGLDFADAREQSAAPAKPVQRSGANLDH